MASHKHDIESLGSKPRDHQHPRHHFVRRAHKDWRVWVVAVLMIALIMVYLLSNDLSVRRGGKSVQPTPALNAP